MTQARRPDPGAPGGAGAVATITLDGPRSRNALSGPTGSRAARRGAPGRRRRRRPRGAADRRQQARSPPGRTCASWRPAYDAGTPPDLGRGAHQGLNPLDTAVATMPKPVVAAIPGPAAGAGHVAGAGLRPPPGRAVRRCSSTAFTGIGLTADAGMSWMLPAARRRRPGDGDADAAGAACRRSARWNSGSCRRSCRTSCLHETATELAARLARGRPPPTPPSSARSPTRRRRRCRGRMAFEAELQRRDGLHGRPSERGAELPAPGDADLRGPLTLVLVMLVGVSWRASVLSATPRRQARFSAQRANARSDGSIAAGDERAGERRSRPARASRAAVPAIRSSGSGPSVRQRLHLEHPVAAHHAAQVVHLHPTRPVPAGDLHRVVEPERTRRRAGQDPRADRATVPVGDPDRRARHPLALARPVGQRVEHDLAAGRRCRPSGRAQPSSSSFVRETRSPEFDVGS